MAETHLRINYLKTLYTFQVIGTRRYNLYITYILCDGNEIPKINSFKFDENDIID